MKKYSFFVPAIVSACISCAMSVSSFAAPQASTSDHAEHAQAQQVNKAIAVLHPSAGSTVTGVVTFTEEPGGVHVVGKITGLTPGKHGFHIHEFGDCSAPDASSAGGHFNPTHQEHAGLETPKRHSGDMGNITADEEGTAHIDLVSSEIHLNGPLSCIGHSLIVHSDPDDLKTQPTGNSGGRMACGVIGVAKP